MTKGEEMLGRPLKKHKKAGVPHYVPGQHAADIVGDDYCYHAVLSYVSAMGHAVQILCKKTNDRGWIPAPGTVARSAAQTTVYRSQALPDDFSLSADSIAALDAAVEREERDAGAP